MLWGEGGRERTTFVTPRPNDRGHFSSGRQHAKCFTGESTRSHALQGRVTDGKDIHWRVQYAALAHVAGRDRAACQLGHLADERGGRRRALSLVIRQHTEQEVVACPGALKKAIPSLFDIRSH